MLLPGQKPCLNFEVDAIVAGKATRLPFADLVKGLTVVSVWMRNNTSTCDLQALQLSKVAPALKKKGVNLVGVSRDNCGSHLKYADRHDLGYTLVADPKDDFSQALDAMVEKSMYGRKYTGPARAAYLFDAKGKLLAVLPKVEAATHGEQLLAALKALK